MRAVSPVLIAGILFASACAEPEPTPSAEQVVSTLSLAAEDRGLEDGVCCAEPFDGAPPGCCFRPEPEILSLENESLRLRLGCGPAYFMVDRPGIVGSFCPDSPSTRRILNFHRKRGWVGPFCNDCVNIPAGQLFVAWTRDQGPLCPSSCPDDPLPP